MSMSQLTDEYIDDMCDRPIAGGSHRYRKPELWRTLCEEFRGSSDNSELHRTLLDNRRVFFTSDQHFGHRNIIRYSKRPFVDLVHMREEMILRHNETVGSGDTVVCVGDFAFLNDDKANEILDRLNGYHILVVGNHDIEKKHIKSLNFSEKHMVLPFAYRGRSYVCTHYPYRTIPDGYHSLHGHEHVSSTSEPISAGRLNVNCEFHNYYPTCLSTIHRHFNYFGRDTDE